MKKTLLFTTAFIMSFTLSYGKGLELGSKAPSPLKGINQDQVEVDLGEAFANGLTLVYFYPKANTPGCTAQSCSLRDDYDSLVSKGVKVFGVSYDSPSAQKSFKARYNLPFDLIADENKEVSKSFGRSGFLSRQAYLIHDGIVVWRDLKTATRGQAADVETAIAELGL